MQSQQRAAQVLADVTPMVEPIGLDEAFVDVAGAVRLLGPPAQIAAGLRRRVHDELHLECAVGIGRSKMIAKLASSGAKPRASRAGLQPGPGVYLVEPEDELAFLHGHAVEALWGVGPATAKRLHDLGVRTVGDLARSRSTLWSAVSARPAVPTWRPCPEVRIPTRSTRTAQQIHRARGDLSQDLVDSHELERHVLRMADSVATMLRVPRAQPGRSRSRSSSRICLCNHVRTPWSDPSPPAAQSGKWQQRCCPRSIRARGIRLLGVSASG